VQNKITPDIAIQDGVGSGIGLKNVTRRLNCCTRKNTN